MTLTFIEVCEELKKLEETSLLELLDITSDEIVDKFQDKIEDNFDHYQTIMQEDKEEDFIPYE